MQNTGEFEPGSPGNPYLPVEQWESLEGAFIHYGPGMRCAAFIWVDGGIAYFIMPDYAFPEVGMGFWSRTRPVRDIRGVTAWTGHGPEGTRANYLRRFRDEYLPGKGRTFAQERARLDGVFQEMKAKEARALELRRADALTA